MFVRPDRLTRREAFLFSRLQREYTEEMLRCVLLPLVQQTSPVSLRALDWACVNWSKENNVVCASQTPGQWTNVHQSYLAHLAHWRRRLFDPFRRRARLEVIVDGVSYETTLGQANFALWVYQSGVFAWVLGHLDQVETHMNEITRRQKRARRDAMRDGVRRKRVELTSTTTSPCVAYADLERVRIC